MKGYVIYAHNESDESYNIESVVENDKALAKGEYIRCLAEYYDAGIIMPDIKLNLATITCTKKEFDVLNNFADDGNTVEYDEDLEILLPILSKTKIVDSDCGEEYDEILEAYMREHDLYPEIDEEVAQAEEELYQPYVYEEYCKKYFKNKLKDL